MLRAASGADLIHELPEALTVDCYSMVQAQAVQGYCPQHDALMDDLTGRETLSLYDRLRGVPENKVKSCVSCLLDVLMLKHCADVHAGNYR